MTKQCSQCKQIKPLTEFHKDKKVKSGYKAYCSACGRAMAQKWKDNNKERTSEYNAHYKRAYTYGLTKEAYFKLLEDQDNNCAICNTPQSELSRKLVVDHNHQTGEVRGLLCSHCNVGIGMLKESEDNLTAAIQYLKGRV